MPATLRKTYTIASKIVIGTITRNVSRGNRTIVKGRVVPKLASD